MAGIDNSEIPDQVRHNDVGGGDGRRVMDEQRNNRTGELRISNGGVNEDVLQHPGCGLTDNKNTLQAYQFSCRTKVRPTTLGEIIMV